MQQLSHLPEQKQEELAALAKVILNAAKVEMIWLFGSYATGKWVEETTFENGIRLEYRSDYDILVILPFDDVKVHYKIRNAIKNKLEKKGLLHTKASIIYHSLKDINQALTEGSYFFVDILKEGILLANKSKHELAKPKTLTATEKQQKAQEHFDQWFESATDFLVTFKFDFNREKYKKAAFELHQATERYFHAILLVFTDYKPKQHDIELLEKDVTRLDDRFATVFPKASEEEQYRFDLLKRAYIDARYRMDRFSITRAELEYLAGRVGELKRLTEVVCTEKINSFASS